MKLFIKFFMSLVFSVSCFQVFASDDAMPLSQDNVKKLINLTQQISNKTAPRPGEEYDLANAKSNKKAIEQLGYDPDKTIVASLLFHDDIGFAGIQPLYSYVCFKPEKALQEKLISKETYDIAMFEVKIFKKTISESEKKQYDEIKEAKKKELFPE